jgi:vacuolar-type H+-ATPase subunit E/Vma4
LRQVDSAKAKFNETDAKIYQKMQEADSKIDHLKADAVAKAKEIRKETDAKIDKFDETVVRKTKEAKSGISSWFGGSK